MSIIKHVTLQKIVAHDFRYDPSIIIFFFDIAEKCPSVILFVIMADPVTVYVTHMRNSCGSWRTVSKPKAKGRFLEDVILLFYNLQKYYSEVEYRSFFCFRTSFQGPELSGVTIARTSQMPSSAMLLLLTVGN